MTKQAYKVDLTLLRKLVGELESAINSVQEMPSADKKEELHRFVIDLSRASGLAAGVAQEATALVKDMYQLVTFAQTAPSDYGDKLMTDILGSFSGNSNKDRN